MAGDRSQITGLERSRDKWRQIYNEAQADSQRRRRALSRADPVMAGVDEAAPTASICEALRMAREALGHG
jgi:hypothetical protein